MELRHLRYFVAVAEEGSLTVAAQKRLHTAQPSLSRQIHDLELELGVQLLIRGPRGIELTASGRLVPASGGDPTTGVGPAPVERPLSAHG